MLFNSYEFLFFFLPIVFGIYFWLHRLQKSGLAKGWLVLASLVFYAWWKIAYLPIILISIVCNFLLGLCLAHVSSPISKKLLLILSVGLNLAALGYFKYTHFLLSSANAFLGFHVALPDIILPLGISFFTFTQTAYLVDTYKGKVKDVSFLNYALFVTFFPHLIAGPILHHQEMMPQFEDRKKYKIDGKQLCTGIFLFVVGLVKKVLIADQFAKCANLGFDVSSSLGFWEAWVTSLCYTFQLYFDFSGYTDMALGIALLFNIHLPQNFNSPYKAQNLQDFWRRWHITLSRFLRDYIYIPLGGNRLGEVQTCLNLLITFLIGGIWHGAGWTFIVWGALHGLGLIVHRLWSRFKIQMPKLLAWFITFHFVNLAWVFFRAKNLPEAFNVLTGMVGLHGITMPQFLEFLPVKSWLPFGKPFAVLHTNDMILLYLLGILWLVTQFQNSNDFASRFKPSYRMALVLGIVTVVILYQLTQESQFLYFNF